ncbi:MAG: hypothetical protein ACI84D_003389 [Thalassolituus oleivorans]|jgi:hypothetical protein
MLGLADSDDAFISLAAFEASVRIDSSADPTRLGERICGHADWPEHSVAEVILHLNEESRNALINEVSRSHGSCVARVIAALEEIHHAGPPAWWSTNWIRLRPSTRSMASSTRSKDDTHVEMIEARINGPGARTSVGLAPWEQDYVLRSQGWRRLDERGGADA